MNSTKVCESCQVYDKPLKACSGCNNIYYCSRSCQLADWKIHKEECTEMMFAKLFETFEFEPFETCQKKKKGGVENDIIIQKGFNLISFLKTFYTEQYNPDLNRLSPFLLPADDKIISCSVRPGDFFGLIIYNRVMEYGQMVGRRCNIELTKEDSKICIVDYEAISSFVQYFVYQQQDLRKLLKNRKGDNSNNINEDKLLLIEKVVKHSVSFVMKCLINDLQDVHCYSVKKTDKWNLHDPSHNEQYQSTFRIYLEKTSEDMLRKIKLDPSIPYYHFLFRSITKTMLIEKTKYFNNDFLSYLQHQFKKLETY